ncbi:geranylgeranyl reductase family protein [Candidatus Binatia bacterium]|nr:geranylgeranyl reductase family protein [Candidatus Binatia bacterium]
MSRLYDAVVVGAGPAGSAAAFHAASAGRRVLLIDRSGFPREKTCGDAVSPRGIAALRRMGVLEPLGWRVVGTRFVRQPGGEAWYEDFRTHDGPGWGSVIRRSELDQRLVAAAQTAGADVVTAAARDIEIGADGYGGVTLGPGGEGVRVRARAVVIATGSGGTAQLLRPRSKMPHVGWGIAARGYFASDDGTGRELRIFFPVRIHGRVYAGYVWAFPAAERCWNIGVGIFRSAAIGAVSLRSVLREFLLTVGPGVGLGALRPLGPVSSAPIAVEPLVDSESGLLAVGDAAGLANPFTGEGIAAALESGELAGRLLADDPDGAGRRYAGELARLFPGRPALRPALRALYEHADLFLGRGADAVTGGTGLVGGALRGLVWDNLPRCGGVGTAPGPRSGLLDMCSVMDGVVSVGRRMRPLFGELLAGIVIDPRSGLGWSAAFAIAAAGCLEPAQLPLRMPVKDLLVVVEIVEAVAALHRDLLPHRSSSEGGTWGRNTVALALADALTAEALRRLYACDEAEAVAVGGAARRFLRAAAIDAASGTRQSSGAVALFMAAAGVAVGGPGSTLPAWMRGAAAQVAAAHTVTAEGGNAAASAGDVPMAEYLARDAAGLFAAWRALMHVPGAVRG